VLIVRNNQTDTDSAETALSLIVPPNFSVNSYVLEVTNGIIQETGLSGGTFPYDTYVHIQPDTPPVGQFFMEWSGDTATIDVIDRFVTRVHMSGDDTDISVTAVIVDLPRYTLTVIAQDGSITHSITNGVEDSWSQDGDVYTGIFSALTNVTLTAKPDTNYTFTSWSGYLTGTNNPETILVNTNRMVTATFEPTTYEPHTITATIGGSEGGKITFGEDVIADSNTTVGTFDVTDDEPKTFTIQDSSREYNPYADLNHDGRVSRTDVVLFGLGTDAPITLAQLQAALGSQSSRIKEIVVDGIDRIGDAVVTNPGNDTVGPIYEYTFNNITADHSIEAVFEIVMYNLTVTPGAGGTVTKDLDWTAYSPGMPVTLTATPEEGYSFTGWGGDLAGTEDEKTIIMDSPKDITANFESNIFNLTVINKSGGVVTMDPPGPSFSSGQVVTITAKKEHCFPVWSGAGLPAGQELSEGLTITVDSDKSMEVDFNMYGDVDDSEAINTLDARKAFKHALSSPDSNLSAQELKATNVDGNTLGNDGISTLDVRYIFRRALGDNTLGDFPVENR